MDWHSRKALSWHLSTTLDTDFCIQALESAIAEHGCPQVFIQFTSEVFTEILKHHEIQISNERGHFNVLDDYNREGLGVEVDFSLPSLWVICTLERLIEWCGKPKTRCCDNGFEYLSGHLMGWAEQQQIHLDFIDPDKSQQNAYMEQFSRTVRHQWLEQHLFDTIE